MEKIFSKDKWVEDVKTWTCGDYVKGIIIEEANSPSCWVNMCDGHSLTWCKKNKYDIDDEWIEGDDK